MDYYLAQQDANAAGLRQAKKEAKDDSDGDESDGNQGSLRQRLAQKRKLRDAARAQVEKTKTSPMQQGTGILLKASWTNLIDSFGLTLIYINMHVFLRWVFPSMFCKLGDEWMPKQVSIVDAEANKAAGVSRFLGIAEIMGLLLLDLLAIFLLIIAISSIMMIIDIVYGVIGWLFEWFNNAPPPIIGP